MLYVDLETRSRCDLLKAGARRYAADLSTQIITAVWHFEGTMKTACPIHPQLGTHPLTQLYTDLTRCKRVVAHNAAFDVSILTGPNQCPFLQIPVEKISCTMARAQALSLPGGLDILCGELKLPGKLPAGKALVQLLCKPNRKHVFVEDIDKFKELLAYNVQDVHCLMQVDRLIAELSLEERKVFERTWRKNNVGLPIDVELATAIAMRRNEIEIEAATKLRELTDGVVTAITQRQRILQWANGFPYMARLPNVQKHEVAKALEDAELHPNVRLVLEIVQENGGSAPTKAQALLNRHINGYYKDATRYYGARSGRGTSEGANMFNIARPSGRYKVDEVIAGLKAGFKLGNVALTDGLRACVCAPPGWAIIDNDLSNAELRLALWQAGDNERLNTLAAGEDLYMSNAIRMWALPKNATKETHPKERQDGKSTTLGGNYGMGWKKYKAQLHKLGVTITDDKALDDITKYRRTNPKLVQLWHKLDDTYRNCFHEPAGRTYFAGKIALMKDGTTIWMTLPGGRSIPHYSTFMSEDGNMWFFRAFRGAMAPQNVFGGSLLEISCQSMTRDIITACESDIERELPDIVLLLDIYDSIVALAPVEIAKQREEQMRAIMRQPRSWTNGLPLDAEGYSGLRMKK